MSDSTSTTKSITRCDDCHYKSLNFYYIDNLTLCAQCYSNRLKSKKQELLENETIRNLNVELDNLHTAYENLTQERNDLLFIIKKALSLIEDGFKVSDAIDLLKSELKHYV